MSQSVTHSYDEIMKTLSLILSTIPILTILITKNRGCLVYFRLHLAYIACEML